MRSISLIVMIFLLPIAGYTSNQDNEGFDKDISLAFKTGDVSKLSKYLNSTVDVLILEEKGFYKKNIVETILKDFLNAYRTKEFIPLHHGAKNEAQYIIGTLETEKGNFSVYFLLKKVDSISLIQRIRIESENGN